MPRIEIPLNIQTKWRAAIKVFLGKEPYKKEELNEAIKKVYQDSGYLLDEYQLKEFLNGTGLEESGDRKRPPFDYKNKLKSLKPSEEDIQGAGNLIDGIFSTISNRLPLFIVIGFGFLILLAPMCSSDHHAEEYGNTESYVSTPNPYQSPAAHKEMEDFLRNHNQPTDPASIQKALDLNERLEKAQK